ncbi:uncharacterized protein LOC144367159 [Ictidomys tridecemlineatus]
MRLWPGLPVQAGRAAGHGVQHGHPLGPGEVPRAGVPRPAVDVWSLGVVLYLMLTGHLPFERDTFEELRDQVLHRSWVLPAHVSFDAQDLLAEMLTVDPRDRPSMAEVAMHQWLKWGQWPFEIAARKSRRRFCPDPSTVKVMLDLSFRLTDTWTSLKRRKFEEAMATYLLLRHQHTQGWASRSRGGLCTQGSSPGPLRVLYQPPCPARGAPASPPLPPGGSCQLYSSHVGSTCGPGRGAAREAACLPWPSPPCRPRAQLPPQGPAAGPCRPASWPWVWRPQVTGGGQQEPPGSVKRRASPPQAASPRRDSGLLPGRHQGLAEGGQEDPRLPHTNVLLLRGGPQDRTQAGKQGGSDPRRAGTQKAKQSGS